MFKISLTYIVIAHGIKFEDAARLFYPNNYNVVIESRGFMPHPIHKWLGPSTDGFMNQTNTAVKNQVSYACGRQNLTHRDNPKA